MVQDTESACTGRHGLLATIFPSTSDPSCRPVFVWRGAVRRRHAA